MKTKAFLFAGLGLMAAAAVYGVVDYNKTQHNTAFENMYAPPAADKQTITPVVPEPESETENVTVLPAAEKKDIAVKKAVKKVKTKKVNTAVIKPLTERKLDIRMFSRAPLREKPVEKTIVEEKEPVKEKPGPDN